MSPLLLPAAETSSKEAIASPPAEVQPEAIASPTEKNDDGSAQTIDFLKAWLAIDPTGRDLALVSLNTFVDMPKPLSRYLNGPIMRGKSAWDKEAPTLLYRAVTAARLNLVLEELATGTVGEMATPAEILCVMYGATHDGPLFPNWAEVYLWACSKTIPYYPDIWPNAKMTTEDEYWESIDGYDRVSYRRIKNDYEQLARDIRFRVVEGGRRRGYPKSSPFIS